jgi:hypothetical protein
MLVGRLEKTGLAMGRLALEGGQRLWLRVAVRLKGFGACRASEHSCLLCMQVAYLMINLFASLFGRCVKH